MIAETLNPFDEAFAEWREAVYHGREMPKDQSEQIEGAFYAGAAFAGRVAEDYGHEIVRDAITAHLGRCAIRAKMS